MVLNEYDQLSLASLRALVRDLTRSEQDMQERLTAWDAKAEKSRADTPDPVRKRLFFLLFKQMRRRCAAEKALARRENGDSAPPLFSKGHATTSSSFMTAAARDTACRTTYEA